MTKYEDRWFGGKEEYVEPPAVLLPWHDETTPDRLDPVLMVKQIRALSPLKPIGWELVQDAGDIIEMLTKEAP